MKSSRPLMTVEPGTPSRRVAQASCRMSLSFRSAAFRLLLLRGLSRMIRHRRTALQPRSQWHWATSSRRVAQASCLPLSGPPASKAPPGGALYRASELLRPSEVARPNAGCPHDHRGLLEVRDDVERRCVRPSDEHGGLLEVRHAHPRRPPVCRQKHSGLLEVRNHPARFLAQARLDHLGLLEVRDGPVWPLAF